MRLAGYHEIVDALEEHIQIRVLGSLPASQDCDGVGLVEPPESGKVRKDNPDTLNAPIAFASDVLVGVRGSPERRIFARVREGEGIRHRELCVFLFRPFSSAKRLFLILRPSIIFPRLYFADDQVKFSDDHNFPTVINF